MSRIIFEPLPDDEEAIEAIRVHLQTTSCPWVKRTDVIRAGLHAAMRELRPIQYLQTVLDRVEAEDGEG
jgi:hypothetical protein